MSARVSGMVPAALSPPNLRNDPVAFAKTIHPEFKLQPWQEELLRNLDRLARIMERPIA